MWRAGNRRRPRCPQLSQERSNVLFPLKYNELSYSIKDKLGSLALDEIMEIEVSQTWLQIMVLPPTMDVQSWASYLNAPSLSFPSASQAGSKNPLK